MVFLAMFSSCQWYEVLLVPDSWWCCSDTFSSDSCVSYFAKIAWKFPMPFCTEWFISSWAADQHFLSFFCSGNAHSQTWVGNKSLSCWYLHAVQTFSSCFSVLAFRLPSCTRIGGFQLSFPSGIFANSSNFLLWILRKMKPGQPSSFEFLHWLHINKA